MTRPKRNATTRARVATTPQSDHTSQSGQPTGGRVTTRIARAGATSAFFATTDEGQAVEVCTTSCLTTGATADFGTFSATANGSIANRKMIIFFIFSPFCVFCPPAFERTWDFSRLENECRIFISQTEARVTYSGEKRTCVQ